MCARAADLREFKRTVIWGDFEETTPSGLCFTSGTTGAPKGVTYTHRSSYLHTLRLLQADAMAISSADSVLAVVPMFHANGWGLPFAVPAVGAKLVLPARHTDGASLARLIASEGGNDRRRRADRMAGASRTSRGERRKGADARAHHYGWRAIGGWLHGTHRAQVGRHGADELGNDRVITVRHRCPAKSAGALGSGIGSSSCGSRPTHYRCGWAGVIPAAQRRRTFARARRSRDRALLR